MRDMQHVKKLIEHFLQEENKKPKVLCLLGPTASGKSGLAMQLALQYSGSIVSLDSRAIYKKCTIGTAKPSKEDQKKVPHYLVDIADIDEPINVMQLKEKAEEAVVDITQKGRLPILVGSHTLLSAAVLTNYTFGEAAKERNCINPRHAKHPGGKGEKNYDALVLGIQVDVKKNAEAIEKRVDDMLEAGLLKEVEQLAKEYSTTLPAFLGHGYRELLPVLSGDTALTKAREDIIVHTRKYAKRQRTWMRNGPLKNEIQWITSSGQAIETVPASE